MDLPAGVWYVKAEGLMRGSAPCLGCDPYGKSAPTVFGPVMVKSRDGAFSTSTLNPENSTSLQSPQTLKPSHVVQACPKGRRDPILVVCASCSTHTKSLSCSASLPPFQPPPVSPPHANWFSSPPSALPFASFASGADACLALRHQRAPEP